MNIILQKDQVAAVEAIQAHIPGIYIGDSTFKDSSR